MPSKLASLLRSRRFWVAIAGVTFALTDGYGLPLTPDQVQAAVLAAGAWVVGDSLRVTD